MRFRLPNLLTIGTIPRGRRAMGNNQAADRIASSESGAIKTPQRPFSSMADKQSRCNPFLTCILTAADGSWPINLSKYGTSENCLSVSSIV
jgi:hypothetical protein